MHLYLIKHLEIIEAKEFFNLKASEIEVVIHPESLVHAIACFHDGGMKAHLGPADMRHAIAYALHEEKRLKLSLDEINLAEIGTLHFINQIWKNILLLNWVMKLLSKED